MDKYECRRLKLIELRDTRCNGVAADLAEKLDRSASYVSRMLYPEGKPGKKRIADDMVELIEKAFDLPFGWLNNQSSLAHNRPEKTDISANATNVEPVTLGGQLVPIVDYVQAGVFAEVCDPYAMGGGFEFIAASVPVSRCTFALKIKGPSMLPRFVPGDIVIIDPDVKPTPGRFVVAKNGDEEATFKKYKPRGHNDRGEELIELVPLNEDFPTIRSDVTKFHIIGTMVEHRTFRID